MTQPAPYIATKKRIKAMSTYLEVVAIHADEQHAEKCIDAALTMAHAEIRIINAWDETSELASVNRGAGRNAIKVSDKLYGLLKRAVKICDLTDGLFDITFASIDKVWFFDKPMDRLPSEDNIRQSVARINYQKIYFDDRAQSVFLIDPGMKVELGAIGKGYIVNLIKNHLLNDGILSGMVNAGGDLVTWGLNEYGKPWRVAVANPAKKMDMVGFVEVVDTGVATSGNYEKFVMLEGKRYSHIIHPKTGWPIAGISSVTVIFPDAELADALATCIYLKGVKDGLLFMNSIEGLTGFIIDDAGEWHCSENFNTKNIQVHG